MRSFGADPELAARHTAAWVRGHQVDGRRREREALPRPRRHRRPTRTSRCRSSTCRSRRSATASSCRSAPRSQAGARTIMTSHILLPRLDPEQPATFSPAHPARPAPRRAGVRGRHRHRRARHGRARAACIGIPEAAVRALAAGCDLLCIGTRQHRRPARRDRRRDRRRRRVRSASRRTRCARRPHGCGRSAPLRRRSRPPRSALAAIEPTHSADELARIAAAFEVTDAARARLAASGPVGTVVRVDTVANIAVGVAPWGRSRSPPRRTLGAPGSTTPRSSRSGDGRSPSRRRCRAGARRRQGQLTGIRWPCAAIDGARARSATTS